jgi:hypothetical protein
MTGSKDNERVKPCLFKARSSEDGKIKTGGQSIF